MHLISLSPSLGFLEAYIYTHLFLNIYPFQTSFLSLSYVAIYTFSSAVSLLSCTSRNNPHVLKEFPQNLKMCSATESCMGSRLTVHLLPLEGVPEGYKAKPHNDCRSIPG